VPGERLPVVVVDIWPIKGGKDIGSTTDRKALRELIGAIAAAHPRAIGVDIDFSPNTDGPADDQDQGFFDYCKSFGEKNPPVPIYLGVYRARDDGKDAWLGGQINAPLAADVQIKIGSDADNDIESSRDGITNRMATWYLPRDKPKLTPLPTMSFALANSYMLASSNKSWPAPPLLLGVIPIEAVLEHTSLKPNDVKENDRGYLLNFSKIRQLHHETLLTTSAQSATEFAPYLTGKVVILGDAAHAQDHFTPPVGPSSPGVYAHALGAYTLLAEPVYELKPLARVALDFIFTIPLFWMVLRRAGKRSGPTENAHGVDGGEYRMSLLCAVSVSVLGIILMKTLHIMWLDFMLVALAQLLHPHVQLWIDDRHRRRTAYSPTPSEIDMLKKLRTGAPDPNSCPLCGSKVSARENAP